MPQLNKYKKLSPEIAGFLMNLTDQSEPFIKFIESTKNKSFDEVKYLGGNSATIATLMDMDFSEMDMSYTVLIGANFNNAKLIKSNLSNAVFNIEQKEPYYVEPSDTMQTTLYFRYIDILEKLRNLNLNDNMMSELAYKLRELEYKIIRLQRFPIENYFERDTNDSSIIFEQNLEEFFSKREAKNHQIDKKSLLKLEKMIDTYYNFMSTNQTEELINENNRRYINQEIHEKRQDNILTTFVGADLKGANLSNTDLRGLDLRNANLVGVNLIGAKLSGINLSNADLRGVDLSGADLEGANLNPADLRGAKLIRAKLNGANLANADLTNADLREANLIGAKLISAKLSRTNMTGAVR